MTSTSKRGRPSSATPELKEQIIERMIEGESLRTICKSEGMPTRTSVERWLDADESFRGRYARARELQAHHYADLIQEIALSSTPETAHADRVKLDALKWLGSKFFPRLYGDKVQHVGSDGEGPVETALTITFRRPGDTPRQDLIEGNWREDEPQ